MKRPVFFAVLLGLLCTAPLVALGMPSKETMPSALARIGMPGWPDRPIIKRRNFNLPVLAMIPPSVLPPSEPKTQSASQIPQVVIQARSVNPKPHLQIIAKKLRPAVRASAQVDAHIYVGGLY
jgi:hypothetical protein